jgi:hypothetical protein
LAKTGPARNSNSRVFWLKIESPVTSVGWRSGVHWSREKAAPSIVCAIEQNVPAGDERGEHERDLVVLTDDHALDVGEQAPSRLVDGPRVVDRLRFRRLYHSGGKV